MLTNPLRDDVEVRVPSNLPAWTESADALAGAELELEFHFYSPTHTPATAANALRGYDLEVRRAFNLLLGYGFGRGGEGPIPPGSMELTGVIDGSLGATWKLVHGWATDFLDRIRGDFHFRDSETEREGGLEYIQRVGLAATGLTAVAALLVGGTHAVNLVVDLMTGDDEARTVLPAHECVTDEFLNSLPESRVPRESSLEVVCTIRTPDGDELTVRVTIEG